MTDVTTLRPDWKIARGLSRDLGLEAARDWMKAAFVDLRATAFNEASLAQVRAWQELSGTTTIEEWSQEMLPEVLGRSKRATWADAVYMIGGWKGHRVDSCLRIQVTPPTKFISFDPAGRLKADHRQAPEVVLHSYIFERGDWVWRVTCMMWSEEGVAHKQVYTSVPKEHEVGAMMDTTVAALTVLTYFEECNEHLVEMRPEVSPPKDEKQRRKREKTARNCPWLNPGAPRIVLLDPSKQYPDHGRALAEGSHASPIPHQRRGHWRVLKSARYGSNVGSRVWVRPTWIGDREWVHRGSVYRVLEGGAG